MPKSVIFLELKYFKWRKAVEIWIFKLLAICSLIIFILISIMTCRVSWLALEGHPEHVVFCFFKSESAHARQECHWNTRSYWVWVNITNIKEGPHIWTGIQKRTIGIIFNFSRLNFTWKYGWFYLLRFCTLQNWWLSLKTASVHYSPQYFLSF